MYEIIDLHLINIFLSSFWKEFSRFDRFTEVGIYKRKIFKKKRKKHAFDQERSKIQEIKHAVDQEKRKENTLTTKKKV